MKKMITIGVTALAALSLAACGNSNSKDSSSSSKASITKVAASSTNQKIAKDVAKEFNTNGEKTVKTTVETNIVDDQSKKDKNGNQVAHQEVKIMVQDKSTISKLKKDKAAIDNGSATSDQKMYIASIQDIITKAAKKLNSTDTIIFGYEEDNDNIVLIAKSMKSKNIIKPVSI